MLRAEPQRHRGTEKTQSRPTSQTRRQEDTKLSQRPPTNPLNAEARRRRDAENPREFSAWQGSGRRTAAKDRWNEPQFRSRAIVTGDRSSGLRSGSAGLATSHLYLMVGRGTPPFQIGERRGGTDALPARRPVGRLAATSARAWSGRTSHRRSAIVRSPAVPPSILGTSASHQRQPLCVLCVFAVFLGGRLCFSAALPLCVLSSVSELCVSVPLWFAGGRFLGTA